MTRRVLMVLALVVTTYGCGDGKKSTKPAYDAGGGTDTDGGATGDTNGNTTGGTSGGTTGVKQRIDITDAPNCADDDLTTPGSECVGVVACGGSEAKPHACPTETHACCITNVPAEQTVNCYESASLCPAIGSVVPCDGPEDCTNGNICCVTPPLVGHPIAECRPLLNCDESSEGSIFCHTDDDCPAGRACRSTATAPFWAFCM